MTFNCVTVYFNWLLRINSKISPLRGSGGIDLITNPMNEESGGYEDRSMRRLAILIDNR